MNHIPFTKMQGLGNDFAVIDGVTHSIKLNQTLIRDMADRHFGIGFDQLLLLEKTQDKQADFSYRIFNADGNEVGQCGNGARCAAKFLLEEGLTQKKTIILSTQERQLTVIVQNNDEVSVNMGIPKFSPKDIPFQTAQEQLTYPLVVDNQTFFIGVANMGNPHIVLIVDDTLHAPVLSLGPKFESHSQFPEKANVGFMQILDKNHIRLRVYERGAGETLACGSGACAAVAIGHRQNLLSDEVEVELAGGKLNIRIDEQNHSIWMTGAAEIVFKGEWLK